MVQKNNFLNPLVSVIIPFWNTEKYIGETLVSVLKQSMDCIEIILIDDCSTDSSNEIINFYAAKDPRIRLIQLQKNSGPANARNAGISAALGRYIAFLDSDDLWAPEKLNLQIKFMSEKDAAFSYCRYKIIDADSKILGQDEVFVREIKYKELLYENIIACSSVVYDSHKLGKVYMPDIKKRQDYGLWLKILKKIPTAYGLDQDLVSYRVLQSSLSHKKLSLIKYNWQLFRQYENLPLWRSAFYLCANVYFRMIKYYKQNFTWQNQSNS